MAEGPGMEKDELRKLLTVAKKTPVNAAIGMTKDGAPALLLHKIKQPRALSKELESGSADLKNMRWGEFFVDEEKDPKTLVARLNKPASGLARKLVKAVKFAGFSKVLLQFEDGTTEAGEDDEPGLAEPGPAAPAADSSPPDVGPVTARVTTLVKRMLPLIQADPSLGDAFKLLAREAQSAIQARDVSAAEAAADRLEQAITQAASQAPSQAQAAPAEPAIVEKAWIAVRQRIDLDFTKLLDAVRAAYQDHGNVAEIERLVRQQLDGVLGPLNQDLAHKLTELGKAAPADRPRVAAEAKSIAERVQKHVATDKLFGALDSNPFVPLSVQKTTTAALSAIVRNIH